MKKTISVLAIASALALSSQANAKTEGSYVGLDVLRVSENVKNQSSRASDSSTFYTSKRRDSSYGFGVHYKYAFNFNGFFVAPEVSYNSLRNDAKTGYLAGSVDGYSQNVELKSSRTLQVNLGYDINDKFAAYVPVGISSFSYEVNTKDGYGDGTYLHSKKTSSQSTSFIGLGASYEPVKNWVVNLEYNRFQPLKIHTPTATIGGGLINSKVNISAVKLGVSYKF